MSVDQQENLDVTNPAPTAEDATPHAEPGSVTSESYEAPTGPSPSEDVDRLVPDPAAPFKLASGTEVTARPLKLREFLSLLKIITRGAAMAMQSIRLDTNDEDFMQSMISLFIFAIPEAEEEACDFLRLMVDPVFPPKATNSEKDDAVLALSEELENPELEDLVSIIEVIIRREGKDLRSLGKRLGSMMETAQKVGQI